MLSNFPRILIITLVILSASLISAGEMREYRIPVHGGSFVYGQEGIGKIRLINQEAFVNLLNTGLMLLPHVIAREEPKYQHYLPDKNNALLYEISGLKISVRGPQTGYLTETSGKNFTIISSRDGLIYPSMQRNATILVNMPTKGIREPVFDTVSVIDTTIEKEETVFDTSSAAKREKDKLREFTFNKNIRLIDLDNICTGEQIFIKKLPVYGRFECVVNGTLIIKADAEKVFGNRTKPGQKTISYRFLKDANGNPLLRTKSINEEIPNEFSKSVIEKEKVRILNEAIHAFNMEVNGVFVESMTSVLNYAIDKQQVTSQSLGFCRVKEKYFEQKKIDEKHVLIFKAVIEAPVLEYVDE